MEEEEIQDRVNNLKVRALESNMENLRKRIKRK